MENYDTSEDEKTIVCLNGQDMGRRKSELAVWPRRSTAR